MAFKVPVFEPHPLDLNHTKTLACRCCGIYRGPANICTKSHNANLSKNTDISCYFNLFQRNYIQAETLSCWFYHYEAKNGTVSAYNPKVFFKYFSHALTFLLERAIFYVDDVTPGIGSTIDAMLEKRGKVEDKILLESYNELREKGTYWVTPERMKDRMGKLQFVPKAANIVGLQIADLIAYPIACHITISGSGQWP